MTTLSHTSAARRSILDEDVASDRLAVRAVAAAVAFMPLLRPGFNGDGTPADVLIALAIGATLLWLGTYRLTVRLPLLWPVGLMVAAGTLAAALGDYPVEGAFAVAVDIALFAWCASVANVCRTPEALATVLRTWTWSALAWGGLLVVAAFGGLPGLAGQGPEGGRAALTFVSPNQAGNYFAISLFVLFASPSPRRPAARAVAAAVMVTALFLAASNAALGGALAGLILWWVLTVARRHGAVPAIAATTLIVASALVVVLVSARLDIVDAARNSQTTVVRNTIGRSERSAEDRLAKLEQLRELYLSGGLIGRGPASTKPVLSAGTHANVKSAHNDYVATIVERGVVGAAGLALLVGGLAAMAAAIAIRPLSRAFASVVRTPRPLVGALVAVALAGMTHEILHFRHVWALFGLVAAIYLWGREDVPARAGEGASP